MSEKIIIPEFQADALDKKIIESFPGMIVRKDLSSLMRNSFGAPTFVLEYLLGMYCATDDQQVAQEGINMIQNIMSKNYASSADSELLKFKIREKGQYTVIDQIEAHLDEKRDCYVAQLRNLEIGTFILSDLYVETYPKILSGGIWAMMKVVYKPATFDVFDDDSKASKLKNANGPESALFNVAAIEPIQMPSMNLDDFIEKRKNFTAEEWKDLLLRSAGYEPNQLSAKEKMHFLERMVPLVEGNYNLCELGPRGTGKSHLYSECSPYSHLLSGGQTTTAELFGHLSGRYKGMLVDWDCIAFDEVAGMRYKNPESINILKGYMANGQYGRGRSANFANCSLVYEGNINDSPQAVLKRTHLFSPFPPEFNNDSAFFDRMHYYLPGWEIPKMRSSLLTGQYALVTDCLSEFFHRIRRSDYAISLNNFFETNDQFNQRDEIAVRKTVSGLLKLVYPDKNFEKEGVREILEYAIEGRRRVKEQLKIMAGIEFSDVELGYIDVASHEEKIVSIPEQPDGFLISEEKMPAGFVIGVGDPIQGAFSSNSPVGVGIWRLENNWEYGTGRLVKENAGRGRTYLDDAYDLFDRNGGAVSSEVVAVGRDYAVHINDLQGKGMPENLSLAEFIGLCSSSLNIPVMPGLVIPGVIHVSKTMDAITNLKDIVRVAVNAGAKRLLLPESMMQEWGKLSYKLTGNIVPVAYPDGDFITATKIALEI